MDVKHTLMVTVVFGLAAASPITAAGTDATTVRLSTGVDFSSGKFGGTEAIEDMYVPVIAGINSGRFGMRITVPYLSVTGPSGTIIGPDGQPIPGEGEVTTESGLGDISLSLTVYDVFFDADAGLAVDLTGAVKFGTADRDRGLGTGENDFSVYLDGYKFFDRLTLLGSLGYRWRGSPSDVAFNNVALASAGGAYAVTGQTMLGLVVDYRQPALPDSDDIRELTGFASTQLGEDWQMQIYAFTGFTDSSPDWGAGLSFTTSLPRFGASTRQF